MWKTGQQPVFLHTHTALLYLQSHESMKALDYQYLDGELYLGLVLNVMLSKKLYLWPGKKENHPCTIKKKCNTIRIHLFYTHFASILTNFSADASLVVIHEPTRARVKHEPQAKRPCMRQTRVKP